MLPTPRVNIQLPLRERRQADWALQGTWDQPMGFEGIIKGIEPVQVVKMNVFPTWTYKLIQHLLRLTETLSRTR